MDFIAFDLETTGIVAGIDQIVEIGAVKFINGEPDSVFATLVDPQRPIPSGASRVNGITDEMVRGKPKMINILDPFADFCEDLPLVAYNAPFDSQFIISDVKKYESKAPKGIVIDALPLSRKLFRGLANYKLGTIVDYLKISSDGFHRAEEDATYCGQIFLEIVKRLSSSGKEPTTDYLISLIGKPAVYFPQIIRQPKQMDLFG